MILMTVVRGAIDRLERDERGHHLAVIVLDDGQQLVVPAEILPKDAKEGDVLILRLEIDRDETERRRARIRDLQRELFGEW